MDGVLQRCLGTQGPVPTGFGSQGPGSMCGPARPGVVLPAGSEFGQGTPQDQDPRELLPVSTVM